MCIFFVVHRYIQCFNSFSCQLLYMVSQSKYILGNSCLVTIYLYSFVLQQYNKADFWKPFNVNTMVTSLKLLVMNKLCFFLCWGRETQISGLASGHACRLWHNHAVSKVFVMPIKSFYPLREQLQHVYFTFFPIYFSFQHFSSTPGSIFHLLCCIFYFKDC